VSEKRLILLVPVLNKVWQNAQNAHPTYTLNGYDIEELTLPKATCYLVSCKQCKTILGIVQEK
jgi:hypothetical protein